MRGAYRFIALFLCLCFFGCTEPFPSDKIDPAGDLSRKDYLALRERGLPKEAPTKNLPPLQEPPIPALSASDLALPPVLEKTTGTRASLPDKKVSVALTESIPLRDVLIEMGREGQMNMEIDPHIEGGIIFSAYQQPFGIVLERLCALAGLRYNVEDGFIRVELDEPYQQSYTLDYPSLSRQTSSEISIATNVFDVDVSSKNGADSTGSNADNNSTAKLSSKAEANFWSELEKALPQILATAQQSQMAVKNKKNEQEKANFSLDKQAGLVSVFGTAKQQEAVRRYLDRLQTKTSAQVLIEARIVEVELADGFQSGINWSALFKNSLSLTSAFGAPGVGALMSDADTGLFTAAWEKGDFTGILNLVRTFGTTRVLSSPRLTVMNNQTAVLKVARNEVYFLTSAQFPTTTSATGIVSNGNPVFSSTPRTVPVGLVMTVQPAINLQSNRVTLTLRPTISRVVDRVTDPSIGLNAAYADTTTTVQSQIPVLAVREMDSVLQLQSGEVAVMGGLMQDSSENSDQGVPPFDAVPVLGNLAKSRDNQGKTSELVILLRATILNNPRPDGTDANLYEKYGRDPRPLDLPPL